MERLTKRLSESGLPVPNNNGMGSVEFYTNMLEKLAAYEDKEENHGLSEALSIAEAVGFRKGYKQCESDMKEGQSDH